MVNIEELTSQIHEIYEDHDGGAIWLPEEKQSKIKELLTSHPKPVDEPKQLPNTTEGMSAEELRGYLRHNQNCKLVNGQMNMRSHERHSLTEDDCTCGYKDIMNQLTSNNQQTEGEEAMGDNRYEIERIIKHKDALHYLTDGVVKEIVNRIDKIYKERL